MEKMSLTTKIIGAVGFSILAIFIFRMKKENSNGEAPIKGLNMNIDPNMVVDSVMPFTKIPKHLQNPLGNGVKKFIYGYMSSDN